MNEFSLDPLLSGTLSSSARPMTHVVRRAPNTITPRIFFSRCALRRPMMNRMDRADMRRSVQLTEAAIAIYRPAQIGFGCKCQEGIYECGGALRGKRQLSRFQKK
jgi:hypothetical protein